MFRNATRLCHGIKKPPPRGPDPLGNDINLPCISGSVLQATTLLILILLPPINPTPLFTSSRCQGFVITEMC